MKVNYYPDTDTLIDLSGLPGFESRVISEFIVLDYDSEGHLVGIDIDKARRKVELPTSLHSFGAPSAALPGYERDE
ncbi:MAG: DUF2283 domain-containing protein [Nitrospirales bacterium]